jgi:dsRNA-specific ribonuclease
MSVEIFRSHLSIEAEIVRSLLEAHGLDARVSSTLAPGLFPLRFGGQAEFRVSVRDAHADRAASVIAGHLDEAAAGEVRRLSETVGPLETRIGYHFRDLGLLEHALTHRSRAHEDASGGVVDNESLEFLGDAVLGFVIADMLFQRFPTHTEGYKSKIKASIVSTVSLAKLALSIDLGRYVLLGRGEEKTGGRGKNAILADSFEALIAAIYLDGGVDAARAFIGSCFVPLIDSGGDRRHAWPAGLPADGDRRSRPSSRVYRGCAGWWCVRGTRAGAVKKGSRAASRQSRTYLPEGAADRDRRVQRPGLRSAGVSLALINFYDARAVGTRTSCREDRLRFHRCLGQTRCGPPCHGRSNSAECRRCGTAIQPHIHPQQRVVEHVALALHHDKVHVFEPRQIVLGRTGGAMQALRDFGERQ